MSRVERPDGGELMSNNSHGIAVKYEAFLNLTGEHAREQRAVSHSYARDLLPSSNI